MSTLQQPTIHQNDPSRDNPVPNSLTRQLAARPVVQPDLLSFHRLTPRRAGALDLPLLGSAYECWSQVWKQTFTELEGRSVLHSDDFTRQDEIGALFHGYECIALFFSRLVDLSNPLAQYH
jgi:hypothetical protein